MFVKISYNTFVKNYKLHKIEFSLTGYQVISRFYIHITVSENFKVNTNFSLNNGDNNRQ